MLNEALRQVVVILDELHVPHALIGGLAVAAHGVVRATKDVDFLVVLPLRNAPALAQSLRERGLEATFRRGGHDDPVSGSIQIEVPTPPGSVRCDLLLAGRRWQSSAVANALAVDLEGFTVRVVQPADLFLLKLYAGGPMDLYDAAHLLELQSEREREEWEARAEALGERDALQKCRKLLRKPR